MKYVADLHIHSKFSRATSREMTLDTLARWAKIKGINLLATGDFTHPEWLFLAKEKLVPSGNGFFKLKNILPTQSIFPNQILSKLSCKIVECRRATLRFFTI